MTDGSEDDVSGVALATLEVAAAEVPIILHVADDGFDSRAAAQFALDDAEDAALLTGDEDAVRVGRVVAAIALVDIGALDRAAGELLGGIDDDSERVAVIGVVRQRLGMEHELAARGAGIGGDDRGLDAELIGRPGLALADAFDLGRVEGISFHPRWRCCCERICSAYASGRSNAVSSSAWSAILRRMSRMRRPSRVRSRRNCRW